MAKAGGTLSANTNVEVLGADMQRQTLSVTNAASDKIIYMEFGAEASTTATDDSWIVLPSTTLNLSVRDFPEIRDAVNLKAIDTAQYVVRTA